MSRDALADEAVRSLRESYDIGEWQSWERAPKGHDNTSFFVDSSLGRFVLRRSNDRKDIEGLLFELRLIEHLRANGYPAPALVSTRRGQKFHQYGKVFYILTRFIPGIGYDSQNPKHLQEAGRGLALYHRVIQRFPGPHYQKTSSPTTSTLWTDSFTERGVVDRIAEKFLDNEELRRWIDTLTLLKEQFDRARRELAEVTPGLTKLVTQGSFGRSALIFNGDTLAGVVDYDRAMYDYRGRDLAYTVRSLCRRCDEKNPLSIDLKRYQEFFHAYQEVEALSRAEIETLPVISRGQRLVRVMTKWINFLKRNATTPQEPKKIKKLAKVLELESMRVAWWERHGGEVISAS